jgi:hypothetical protein
MEGKVVAKALGVKEGDEDMKGSVPEDVLGVEREERSADVLTWVPYPIEPFCNCCCNMELLNDWVDGRDWELFCCCSC